MEKEVKEKVTKKAKVQKTRKVNLSAILSAVITFIICIVVFGVFYNYYLKNIKIEKQQKEVTVTDTGIADAVEKVYDSVVVVQSYINERLVSTGTGFVFSSKDDKGFVLTNAHVISDATEVKLTLTNEKTVNASLVGIDTYSDIAVLSIDKSDVLKVAEIGKSSSLRVGDTTFAVGAPIDSKTYSWTVTRGIISGKDREVSVKNSEYSASYIMKVLQTDTAINSGNSGGPLCNSNGEVIGITNMKMANSAIEGMGFAIPIETAVQYAEQFMEGKKISRPYLGISIYDVTPSLLNDNQSGLYIDSVEKNSPADKGGLKSGDKILKINDEKIADSSYFKYELYKYNVGDKIKITVERDNKEKTISVTLGTSNETA